MIWNIVHDEERLRLWKQLREEIKELKVEEQLKAVAKFCSSIPFGSRSLDYYSPWDWPTPWEILFHGSFCTSSISLLMCYTLVMASEDIDIELYLVEDDRGIYLLPVISNQYVLNYELGSVNNYPEVEPDIKVLQKYTKEQIKQIK
jgi:hypothetical protein